MLHWYVYKIVGTVRNVGREWANETLLQYHFVSEKNMTIVSVHRPYKYYERLPLGK